MQLLIGALHAARRKSKHPTNWLVLRFSCPILDFVFAPFFTTSCEDVSTPLFQSPSLCSTAYYSRTTAPGARSVVVRLVSSSSRACAVKWSFFVGIISNGCISYYFHV